MLGALLGPCLLSKKPIEINLSRIWLGLGSLYVSALASKCFNKQVYSQKALEICDIGEEVLSGIELFNETQNIISSSKWKEEAHVSPGSSDFSVRRIQAYSQIIFSSIEIFCNTVRVGFFLKRLQVIQLPVNLNQQLKRINSVFSLFQQTISFFRESYQLHLCKSLSFQSSQWVKKELSQKCRISLCNIAKTVAKIFLLVLGKIRGNSERPILALSCCILALEVFSHYSDQSLYRGRWRFSENRFIYDG